MRSAEDPCELVVEHGRGVVGGTLPEQHLSLQALGRSDKQDSFAFEGSDGP